MQSEWMALGKSKTWNPLLCHTSTYSALWIIPIAVMLCVFYGFLPNWAILGGIIFGAITFLFHTVTDYITSRENSKLLEKSSKHDFFVSVGFDQVLHYIQIFLTFWLVTKL